MYKDFGGGKMVGFLLPASCDVETKFRLYANDTNLLLKERFVYLTDLFERELGQNLIGPKTARLVALPESAR